MNLKNSEHTTGYDLEELYFEKLNRELIQKRKGQKGTTIVAAPEMSGTDSNVIRLPPQPVQRRDKKAA